MIYQNPKWLENPTQSHKLTITFISFAYQFQIWVLWNVLWMQEISKNDMKKMLWFQKEMMKTRAALATLTKQRIRIFLNTNEWTKAGFWASSKCGAFLFFISLHTHTRRNRKNVKHFFVNETSFSLNGKREQTVLNVRQTDNSLCVFLFRYCKNADCTREI